MTRYMGSLVGASTHRTARCQPTSVRNARMRCCLVGLSPTASIKRFLWFYRVIHAKPCARMLLFYRKELHAFMSGLLVAALYKFVELPDYRELKAPLLAC